VLISDFEIILEEGGKQKEVENDFPGAFYYGNRDRIKPKL